MRAWQHLIFEGTAETTRSFVAGVLADRGLGVAIYWGEELGLEGHSLADRMKDLVLGDHHEELLLPADVADVVVEAVQQGGAGAGVRLTGRRAIDAGWFTWSCETFSRETRGTVRAALLERLPAGVEASDLQESETTDESAQGAHLYTHAHAFEYRASGKLAGTPPGILEVYRVAITTDFVHASSLTLASDPIA